MYIDAEYRKRFARKSALTVSAKNFATVKSVRLNQTLTIAYAYPKSAMHKEAIWENEHRTVKLFWAEQHKIYLKFTAYPQRQKECGYPFKNGNVSQK